MSRLPDIELPQVEERLELVASVHIHTLTPVIGAGVHSQKADRSHPVRGETVRGHLRFWWRTVSQSGPLDTWIDTMRRREARSESREDVRPMSQLDAVEQLRLREAAIWGSSSRAGLVTVQVQNGEWKHCDVRRKKVKDVAQSLASIMDVPGDKSASLSIAYAAFPLQKQNSDPPGAMSEVGMGSFRVTVVWNPWARHLTEEAKSQVEQEVREALWRWIHLGGLGMRWRRGFGALTSDDVPGRLDDLREHLRLHASAGLSCVRAVLVQSPDQRQRRNMERTTVWEAWEDCLQPLRQYRQPRQPKKGATRGFTKTPWPEANVIRAIHRAKGDTRNVALRFPRAVLGLPIIFQFKGESTPNAELRPDKCANPLLGRLPSPFVLRPVRIGEFIYPMCVWLESPLPSHQEHGFVSMSLKVDEGPHNISIPGTAALPKMEDRLSALERGQAQFEKASDALADFLRYLREQGFEVLFRPHAT